MILAQIIAPTGAPEVDSLSIMDLAIKGGFMMIPILLSSFVAVYIFVERVLTINKANQNPKIPS